MKVSFVHRYCYCVSEDMKKNAFTGKNNAKSFIFGTNIVNLHLKSQWKRKYHVRLKVKASEQYSLLDFKFFHANGETILPLLRQSPHLHMVMNGINK